MVTFNEAYRSLVVRPKGVRDLELTKNELSRMTGTDLVKDYELFARKDGPYINPDAKIVSDIPVPLEEGKGLREYFSDYRLNDYRSDKLLVHFYIDMFMGAP